MELHKACILLNMVQGCEVVKLHSTQNYLTKILLLYIEASGNYNHLGKGAMCIEENGSLYT